MNTKILKLHTPGRLPDEEPVPYQFSEPLLLFICLLLIWFFIPPVMQGADQTVGLVDQSMWLLVILSLISFMLICAISWWLVKHFWLIMGLPDLAGMVSQFKTLSICQQLTFFLASFVSLLLAATGCLVAVC